MGKSIRYGIGSHKVPDPPRRPLTGAPPAPPAPALNSHRQVSWDIHTRHRNRGYRPPQPNHQGIHMPIAHHAGHKKLPNIPQQRRMFVKTFVFSVMDYVLYIQPLTGAICQDTLGLERRAASYILGVKIPTNQHDRAMALCRLLPVAIRRQKNTIQAIAKFRRATLSLPLPRDPSVTGKLSRCSTL